MAPGTGIPSFDILLILYKMPCPSYLGLEHPTSFSLQNHSKSAKLETAVRRGCAGEAYKTILARNQRGKPRASSERQGTGVADVAQKLRQGAATFLESLQRCPEAISVDRRGVRANLVCQIAVQPLLPASLYPQHSILGLQFK